MKYIAAFAATAALLVPAAAMAQASPQITAGQALKKKLDEAPLGSKAPVLSGPDGATIRAAFDAEATRKLPLEPAVTGGTCVAIGEAIVAYVDFATRMTKDQPDPQKASDALLDTVQGELSLGAVAANICVQRGFRAVIKTVDGFPAEQRAGTASPLKQMRTGAEQTLMGTINTIALTQTTPANRLKLAASMLEDPAALADSFPADERAAFRKQITDKLPSIDAAVRPQVSKLADAFGKTACNSLCKVGESD